MRKLRLRWLLPSLFLGLTAMELAWSERIDGILQPLRTYVGRIGDLWHALNAPALFLLAIGIHFAPIRRPQTIANFPIDTVLFLAGGTVLWFVIGKMLDRNGEQTTPLPNVRGAIVLGTRVLIFLWGIYLCWQALHAGSATDYLGRRVPGSVLDGVLVFLWSLTLIILSVRSLMRATRVRSPTSP
jgi:hypothetical protein